MKKLWIAFAVVMGVSFSVLGWIGTRIYQERPPLPVHVVSTAALLCRLAGTSTEGCWNNWT
jgi:nitric oxide reductase subunit B